MHRITAQCIEPPSNTGHCHRDGSSAGSTASQPTRARVACLFGDGCTLLEPVGYVHLEPTATKKKGGNCWFRGESCEVEETLLGNNGTVGLGKEMLVWGKNTRATKSGGAHGLRQLR